uniref:NADH-ubiquinone oxidoreductase chain 2 n=1 Tax=Megaphragma amalphitanum TaxID=1735703 RepID=A0A0P0CFG8_9HYME|nr:NADH dehydrogenase subunit 2 [Megaphragma amalphitanum]ALI86570.1 NADH dehydrogenase subunit 2 [Megaphragma amalphitanum]
MLFFPLMIISLMLILICNSWFSFWMVMEINLISFLMLLIFDNNIKNELFMNYFLIQSFNSYLFLMSSFMMNYSMFYMMSFILMMNLSILTKLGLPPFYIWYLKMMKNLNWSNLFILSILQKLIPLFIMMMMMNMMIKNLFILNLFMLIFFSLIIVVLGMNQLNLKLLMAYSSIIQMIWMLMLMYLNENYFLMYFMIYLFIFISLVMIFLKMNYLELIDFSMMKFNNKLMYLFCMLLMMSLGGVPPLMGFLMKWISIQLMSNYYMLFMILLMIINSLISMFFYFRLMFISLMNYSYTMKLNLKYLKLNNLNMNFLFLMWMSMMMLMLYELI